MEWFIEVIDCWICSVSENKHLFLVLKCHYKCQWEVLLWMYNTEVSFWWHTCWAFLFPYKKFIFFFPVCHRKYFGDSKHIAYILKLRIHIKNCWQVSNLMRKFFIMFQTTGLQADFETLSHSKWEVGDWVPRPSLLREAKPWCSWLTMLKVPAWVLGLGNRVAWTGWRKESGSFHLFS